MILIIFLVLVVIRKSIIAFLLAVQRTKTISRVTTRPVGGYMEVQL